MSLHTDFFRSDRGNFHGQWRAKGRLKDMLFDARLACDWLALSRSGKLEQMPVRNILVAGVEVPSRETDLERALQSLSRSRHAVYTKAVPCAEGKGKFQNINAGLEGLRLDRFEWLILVDDDVVIGDQFLDRFIYLAESTGLQICMPAHKFRSNQTFELTVRHWASMVRLTHFVESGPITAFRKPTFPHIFPFPDLKWAWGTDIAWSETARRLGFSIGVVDGTPIQHLRPVGGSYDVSVATDEAEAFLTGLNITRSRGEILQTVKTISGRELRSPVAMAA